MRKVHLKEKGALLFLLLIIMSLVACGSSSSSNNGGGGILPNNPLPPSAKTWSSASSIDNGQSSNVSSVQVSTGSSFFVTWMQLDNSFEIYANRYDSNTGWDTAIVSENILCCSGRSPQIAVQHGGASAISIATFHGGIPGTNSLYATHYTAGTGWGSSASIENFSDDSYSPQISIDNNGNAIAVWQQGGGAIYVNRYDLNSAAWGSPEGISVTAPDAKSPQIAMDDSGNAIAVWYQYLNGSNHIKIEASLYVTGSGWQSPVRIDDDGGQAAVPQIDMDANGNAMAVWEQNMNGNNQIHINRYIAGVGWGTPERLNSGITFAVGQQIAVADNENAIAVWQQGNIPDIRIYAKYYTSGTGWGSEVVIDSGTDQSYEPQVAIDNSGNAIAIWEQSNPPLYSIFVNRFEPATGWGSPVELGSDSLEGSVPQIVIDENGNALAVWVDQDLNRVMAAQYE